MRQSNFLLGLTAVLGISLFIAMFFVLPKPETLTGTYFFPVHLPQAKDRAAVLPTPDDKDGLTISFVGDIMLGRSVEQAIVTHGQSWPFAELDNLFENSDFVVGNFESTIRAKRNIEVTNQMTFDTTPDNLDILRQAGFTHLSLANNHADDYGSQVTTSTRESIKTVGMIPFGDPTNSEQFILRENIGGVSISIIGFHAFGEKPDELLDTIKSEHEQGRFVIIYPHWGVEYATTAPSVEIAPAKQFIAAGADLIIGAHPHVIQNIEVIDGVPVIYSLGNFLFDQDFSSETKRGLTLQVAINDETVDIELKPIDIINRQTLPMDTVAAQKLFTELGLPDGQLSVPRK